MGGKCYSNLGAFCVNQPGRMLGDMLLEVPTMSKVFLSYSLKLNNIMQKRCV
jgi:hypothetical protein